MIAMLLIATASLFAGTADDLGINSYVETFTGVIKALGIAILILGITITGAMIVFKRDFGPKEKVALVCCIAGGILMAVAGTAVEAIFGDTFASGAIMSVEQAAAFGLL